MATSKDERGWNIYRRNDGQYVLQFRVAPGDWSEHRIPRDYRTERHAERYAMAWIAEYRKNRSDRPTFVEPARAASPSIADLAEQWQKLYERNPKLSRAVRVQYGSNLKRHILSYPELASVPISSLGPGTLRAWLRKVRDAGRLKKVVGEQGERTGKGGKWVRTGEPLAPFTCRNVVNTLTAFFDECMAEEWIDLPANPMRHPGVRKEIPEAVTLAGKRVIIHFTRASVEALITANRIPVHRRARYVVAVTSGMRDGEIAALRWEDLDLKAATVSITKGTTCKGGGTKLTGTKNDASMRTIPLHPLAVQTLKAWRATEWAAWVGRHPKPADYVFPNATGRCGVRRARNFYARIYRRSSFRRTTRTNTRSTFTRSEEHFTHG